ncbi:Mitochondrial porin [Mycoblastus sanguinarius]|nr:Mitochondrial porin [Mycoblastus sanguinarius]
MSVPAFSDIAKTSNDLLSRDFYHTAAAKIDVKSKAPNGVSFNVKGTSAHEGSTSASIEAKYADPPSGTFFSLLQLIAYTHLDTPYKLNHAIVLRPGSAALLIFYRHAGLNLTQKWTTANVLETKLELENNIAKGLKAEALTDFVPSSQKFGAKLNLYFRQPNFHGRAFFDVLKGPVANVDAVLGHEGFLVGAEAGYDVQKAALTRYSAAIGYTAAEYSAAITATNSLSVFAASYYHKVNSQVEAGAKATWDSKGSNNVGMEVASKYRFDPTSFAKAKVNDRGIAALAYNVKLRPGVTVGLGVSLDTQNLNEAAHKVGTSFEFEG